MLKRFLLFSLVFPCYFQCEHFPWYFSVGRFSLFLSLWKFFLFLSVWRFFLIFFNVKIFHEFFSLKVFPDIFTSKLFPQFSTVKLLFERKTYNYFLLIIFWLQLINAIMTTTRWKPVTNVIVWLELVMSAQGNHAPMVSQVKARSKYVGT